MPPDSTVPLRRRRLILRLLWLLRWLRQGLPIQLRSQRLRLGFCFFPLADQIADALVEAGFARQIINAVRFFFFDSLLFDFCDFFRRVRAGACSRSRLSL